MIYLLNNTLKFIGHGTGNERKQKAVYRLYAGMRGAHVRGLRDEERQENAALYQYGRRDHGQHFRPHLRAAGISVKRPVF